MALDLEQYIRQAARARGIDPEVAIRVAKSEGGLKDPTRQSLVTKNGFREPSYGPFQLLVGGSNGFPTGLGNRALAAGIDPRTPEGAYKGIDFALDRARDEGWGAWYGAKAQGITGKMGIGNAPPPLSPAAQGFVDNNPQPGGYGPGILDPNSPSQGLAPSTDTTQTAGILGGMFGGIPQGIAEYASAPEPKSFGERLQGAFKKLADIPDAPPVRFGPMGDARQSGSDLLKQLQKLRQG